MRVLTTLLGLTSAILILQPALSAQEIAPASSTQPESTPADAPGTTAPPVAAVPPTSREAVTALLTKLSPRSMRAVGTMLENDWQDRPEWGEQAIAILKGEGMRPGSGWWKAPEKRYDFRWLRERFDRNGDGAVTLDEFPETLPDRESIFNRLDRDLDGQLLLLDFDWFNRSLGTPRAMMTDYMFMRLDADSNGRVSPEELTAFFQNADRDKLGFLTHEDLFSAFDMNLMSRGGGGGGGMDEGEVVRMFLNNELGTFEAGPDLESEAPDFILPTHDSARNVRLSEQRGKRPVVLIFGSFT